MSMMKRPARSLFLILVSTFLAYPAAAQDERPAWTIDHTWAPTQDVSFEVSEGTWMDLDVSPDGGSIVFDLLGDIYTMPIGGGRATRISGGPAFEFQPRFSPDGTRIAFVSDRDGMNNIWTMSPTGDDPRQITSEAERDVNTPTWSADGEYIFARKHFVFSRSLGAGEIWMWHTTGGSGLKVTDRPNEQQDQGEPAVSADGSWVYYSQDVTRGPLFQYNKDPYSGIYAIRRRNLTTGEQETVTGGPGGAIAPTPHPDGTRLAFVRRVRLESVLHIRDLETGEEWPVWDGLEHDMQEAWAIHGPQARFAWVGDSDDIVVWAQGGIWRVDTGTGEASEIPFTAQVDVQVQQAVPHEVDVGADEFKVKMLRHVDTSPDGRRVVFSALGRIWVTDASGGEARRLTEADQIEIYPQFSPDGGSVVYTTFDDEEKGDVRVVASGGGTGRVVVEGPGNFVEPAWSPDGAWIVYRRTGGDTRRGTTHVGERGIYVVDASGGDARLVREAGSGAVFDSEGARIVFSGSSGGGPALQSVDLDGEELVTHYTGSDVQEWTVSPDNRWIAFVQGWKTYIARFAHSGRTVALSPGAQGYPVQQVSAETGTFLHWSGDSQALHWMMGPEYFTRDLTETFTFLDGAAEEPAEPEVEGVDLGFTTSADRPSGTVAFVGGRVITAADDASAHGAVDGVIENGAVVVEGNRIVAVGPAAEVEVPSGAHVVDASGKTLMPGMVDAHAHFGSAGGGIPSETDWPYYANLAFGVTTGHDPSNNNEMIFTDAEMIQAGMKTGPRVFSTGTIVYGAVTPFRSKVDSYEDALLHVRRQKASGAPAIKSYNQRRREARQWLLEAADAEGINVVPEGGSTFNTNVSQVIDGHTTVEHNLPLSTLYDDVVGLWAATEVGYTPTLIVSYGGLSGEFFFYERYNVWENERLLTFTPQSGIDARSRRRPVAAGDEDYHHIDVARHVTRLNDAGVLTNTGAHGQIQGLGMHWETWMFAQGGMSPMNAIKSATINGAKSLGMGSSLGSIEQGKLADLLVLDANPLEDIHNTEHVNLVMVNGRLFDARTMDQVGNHPASRPVLAHERGKRLPN
jgi:Tol biopolymer transport system component/imidazolonepropionase-like amidohydrolase